MKPKKGAATLASAALVAVWSDAADAYRPFDGTDAAVADTGDVEIELGPVEYLRDAAERTLFAPNLRVNYGFAADWEASLEGEVAHGLTAGIPGTSLVESEALLKRVLREGSLQRSPGPSTATQFGILLPGVNDEHGTGAILTGIASQRWDWGTSISMRKSSLPASSMRITFSTPSSGVRTTGWCGPSPKSFTNVILACFGPVPP
jgi:hypothetical protein